MPKIQIITEEILGKAKNVHQGAADIFSSQENVTKTIQNLGKDFSGKLPTLMTEHMLSMRDKYRSMNENLTQYGSFLEHSANTYEWNDKELAKWAAALGDRGASIGASAGASTGAAGGTTPTISTGTAVYPVSGGTVTRHGTAGHKAADIAAPAGTPVQAATGGTILMVIDKYSASDNWRSDGTKTEDYGNLVVIQGDDGNAYYYAHLGSVENLSEGQRIEAGSQLGTVGNTGNSTGPHLHFEMRKGGRSGEQLDPLEELGLV